MGEYYGAQLGKENLYVFFDGEDQEVPDFCDVVNTLKLPKMQGNVVSLKILADTKFAIYRQTTKLSARLTGRTIPHARS